MKIIKILGTGCPNCTTTEKVVSEVINELKIEAKIIKVTDIQEIMAYDIMSTPAVVIDEKVIIKGRVPSASEIKELLKDEACCSDSDTSCCDSDATSASNSCCDPSSNCC